MKKRLLSLILCICLTVSLIPSAPAFAEGEVAEVDGTQYYYFSEALTALSTSTSHTIKLLADCVTDNELGYDEISGNITMNLNGKALSSPLYINSGNSLTIEDSSGTNSNPQGNIFNASEGTLRIIGGTYSFNPAGYVPTGYTVTTSGDNYIVSAAPTATPTPTPTATQTTSGVCRIGDTFYESLEEATDEAVAGDTIVIVSDIDDLECITIQVPITIDIGNHRIESIDDPAFKIFSSTAVTFTGSGIVESLDGTYIFRVGRNNSSIGRLIIAGGIYLTEEDSLFDVKSNSTVSISGGTFYEDVSKYVASGYECVYNEGTGSYTVQLIPSNVCQIGSVKYATLDAAVAAVSAGQVIQLIDNVTLSQDLSLNRDLSYSIDTSDYDISNGGGSINATAGMVTFTSSGDGTIAANIIADGGNVIVTGGKYSCAFTETSGSIILQGGYYTSQQSSDIIANGYECVESTRYSGFEYTVRQIVSDAVCAIGDRQFSSLAAAYVEAQNGDTITLLRHVTGGVLSQPIAKSINIDIGIYDFTFASGSNATVAPDANVTLTGNGGTVTSNYDIAVVIQGTGTVNGNVNICGAAGSITNESGGTFTFNSTGTVTGILKSYGQLNITSGTFSGTVQSQGTAAISGGTFNSTVSFNGNTTVAGGTFGSNANVDFAGTSAATQFNISGGTFYASGNYRTAITKGKAAISNGMFYNLIASGTATGSHREYGVDVVDYDTNVTISGGTVINGTVNSGRVDVMGGSYSTAFTVNGGLTAIVGGEFNGADMTVTGAPTVFIINGSFSNGSFILSGATQGAVLAIVGGNYDQDVGDYCYPGFTCEQRSNNRYYVVSRYGNAAAIGTSNYSTIADAVTAVQEGQTITLLRNTVLSADLEIGKSGVSYTLDLSGCVIDRNWDAGVTSTVKVSSGTVKIYNGGINCNLTADGGAVTISGGKYMGTVSCTGGSLGITGGYFSTSVSAYVLSPYAQYRNTGDEKTAYPYVVGDESLFVAKIIRDDEELKYQTLSGAVDAAQSGETVYMIKDVSISESLTIKSYKNFILDLGSHTLTGTYSKGSSAEAVVLSKNSSVTIQNGNIVSDIGAGTIVTKQTIITNRGDITLNNVNLSAVGVKNPIDCIFNYGTLVMTNSTLTVNNAYSNVWGIYSINSNAHATLTNSTLNLSTDPSSSTITCQGMTDSYSSNYTLTNSTIRISGAGDLHGILKRSSGVITLSGGSVIEVTSNPASSSSNLYGIFNSGSPSVRVDGSQITVNGGKNSRGIEDTRQESTVSILEGSIVSASSYLSTADVRGISKQSDGGKEGKLIVRDSIVNAGNNYGGVVRTVDSWSSIVEMNNATIYAGGASANGYAFYTMNNHEGSTFTNTKIFGLSNTKAISNSQADGQLQINGDDSYYYSPQQGVLTSLIDGKDFGSDDRSVNITAGYYTAMVAGTAIRLYNNASYSTGGYVENGYMCYKLFTPKTYTVTHGDQSTNYTFTHRVVPLPEAMLLDTADNNMQWLEFGTLKEMLELATTGQTVQLLQDVVHTDINYTNGYKDIILDLRGHGVQCSSIEFETAGYITDSSDNDSGYISSVSVDGVSVVSGTTNGGNLPVKLSDGYHFYTVALDKRKTYKSPYSEIKYKVCLTGKDFSNACAGLKTLSNDMSGDLQLIYHVEFDDQGKGHVPVYITEDEERTPHTTAEKFDIISSTWLVNHGANGTSLVPMFRFYNLGCIEGFKFVKCSFTIQSGTGYRLTVEFDDTPVESVVTQQN